MFRYNYYYGHWSSESDSDGEGGWFTNTPNLGEGGRDVDYSPNVPPPPPEPEPEPPVNVPQTYTVSTPAIMCLTEQDDFGGSTAGYIPAGQFTETRAYPLSLVKATKNGVSQMVVVRNERIQYDYAPMGVNTSLQGEKFRIPFYLPPGVAGSTVASPTITYELYTTNNTASTTAVNNFIIGAKTKNGGLSGDRQIHNVGSVPPNSSKHLGPFTLLMSAGPTNRQQIDFVSGFNEFEFFMGYDNPSWLTNGNGVQTQWMITSITTSLPSGYSLEFKLQKNWKQTFNIDVVKDINRLSKGTPTQLITNTNVTPHPIGNGWTLSADWNWNEYATAQGYKHWEIPVTKFSGNYQFDLPITVFPENDDFCSMEPGYKTPGPKAPWNLVSRHETFNYAQHWMRKSDYPQYIGTQPGGAVFYCPRNWRAVVWLKEGTANNDVI